jgi:hypothetical protein
MSTVNDTPKSDTNVGHDGFVWSQRASVITAFVLALALALVRYAPVLAAPIEWQH